MNTIVVSIIDNNYWSYVHPLSYHLGAPHCGVRRGLRTKSYHVLYKYILATRCIVVSKHGKNTLSDWWIWFIKGYTSHWTNENIQKPGGGGHGTVMVSPSHRLQPDSQVQDGTGICKIVLLKLMKSHMFHSLWLSPAIAWSTQEIFIGRIQSLVISPKRLEMQKICSNHRLFGSSGHHLAGKKKKKNKLNCMEPKQFSLDRKYAITKTPKTAVFSSWCSHAHWDSLQLTAWIPVKIIGPDNPTC